jgi:hypothetical protein
VTAFVLGGAAKSGTSTLAELLGAHPAVHVVPRKEAHHHLFSGAPPAFKGPGDEAFGRMVVSDPAEWRELLAAGEGCAAVGEASVYYLYRSECWPRLAEALGDDGRVLLVLRDPVERIRSAWGHLVRDGREPLDLVGSLDAEAARVAAGWEWCWHHRRVSQYHDQLPAVLDAFGRDRVLVEDFASMQRDPDGLARRAFAFLGVDPVAFTSVPVRNPSGAVRSRSLHALLTRPHPAKDLVRPLVPDRLLQAVYHRALARNLRPLPPTDPEVLDALADELRPVADGVRDLVGLDTSRWCQPVGAASETSA